MKNNNEFDYLTIYAKKEKANEIISHYSAFGYTKIDVKENNRYEDLIDITFSRPHKIKNKDELQLNQVYIEEKINELARIEKHKHSKTTSIGLSLGTLCISLITLGILSIVNIINTIPLVFAITFIAFGIVLLILELIFLHKIYKNENLFYKTNSEKLLTEIAEIIKTAHSLIGENYEKN